MSKKVLTKLKELERRIEQLERKPKKGERLQQIADWIFAQFENNGDIHPIKKIIARGERKMGFSKQMMQRARRELLADRIVATVKKSEGWSWWRRDEEE